MIIPDFVAIGHFCTDLANGSRILGGPASYASLTARNLGCAVGVVTAVGRDFPFLKRFTDITLHRIDSSATTTFRNIYHNGTREQIVSAVATPIDMRHVPAAWTHAQSVYLCPIASELMPNIAQNFTGAFIAAGIQGWLREWDKTGHVRKRAWPFTPEATTSINAIIYSELDHADPYAFARKISAYSPLVIITQADKGAELFLGSDRHHVPAFPIRREVDPTGAGDVFAAAFLVRYAECHDPIEAARFACCAASFVCEAEGTDGIPTRDRVFERKRAYDAMNR